MSNKLWVTGLDKTKVDEAVLHAAFIPYGEIIEVHIAMDSNTGLRRGYGSVTYELRGDAEEAMDNLNDAELFGKRIKVRTKRPDGRSSGNWNRNSAVWNTPGSSDA